MTHSIITLLSDFGTDDAFVGIMKGVILGINPAVRVVDLTHAVPPQQVLPAALLLRSAVRFFPPHTIHVAVIDPGVGSQRQAIVIETRRGVLVGPDNGVLWPAAVTMGRVSARRIENTDLCRDPISHSFHGRDIFAPVAAHLSCGLEPEAVGPEAESVVDLQVPPVDRTGSGVRGQVVYVDHFGNLVTNIDEDILADFPRQQLSVSINQHRVAGPVTAYAMVPVGTPLAIVGSWGTVEIAVCNGSAAKTFAAGPGTPVTVVVESPGA